MKWLTRFANRFRGWRFVAKSPSVPLLPSTYQRASKEDQIYTNQVQIRTQWSPTDRDTALREAEQGTLRSIAMLMDSMRSDGLISGIMSTRTSGMFRLPVKFEGDPFLVEKLRGVDPIYDDAGYLVVQGTPGSYFRMCPESELVSLVFNGIFAGVGIAELVPQEDGSPPVLKNLDLHFLRYDFTTLKWHYQAADKSYEVVPGDGRWVLFTPYGLSRPWIRGSWWPVAMPFISKQNSMYDRLRWQGSLADPLKLITASESADERHREGLIDFVTRLWKRSPGLVAPPGYEAKLVESSGRGYEVYSAAEERADLEIQIALAGQTVTTTGTSGFSSGSIWADIKGDLVQAVAETLSTCLHEQVFVPWAKNFQASDANRAPWVRWDLRSPEQRKADAEALLAFSGAVKGMDEVLATRGTRVDWAALLESQGLSVPTESIPPQLGTVSIVS